VYTHNSIFWIAKLISENSINECDIGHKSQLFLRSYNTLTRSWQRQQVLSVHALMGRVFNELAGACTSANILAFDNFLIFCQIFSNEAIKREHR
jgi:hypothetical protein